MVIMRIVYVRRQHLLGAHSAHQIDYGVGEILTRPGQSLVGESQVLDGTGPQPQHPGRLRELGSSGGGIGGCVMLRRPHSSIGHHRDVDRATSFKASHYRNGASERFVIGVRSQDETGPAPNARRDVGTRRTKRTAQQRSQRRLGRPDCRLKGLSGDPRHGL